jgi:phosphatidylserine/phosphatidylglycerophosphate/cardiolipin synthase-like enzyme
MNGPVSANGMEGATLKASQDGLSVTSYRGDGSVLLAFNLEDQPQDNLAGFAIHCTPPQGRPYFLRNRLNFKQGLTSSTTPAQRRWTSSDEAPFQKFRWVDFLNNVQEGEYQYTVTAKYFGTNGKIEDGQSVALLFPMVPEKHGNFEMGFTRGYLSSQAYASRFKNAPFRPAGPKTARFDTAPYQKRYEWLGFHARKMVFDFLNAAIKDPAVSLDVFAYDLDEPDIIRSLEQLGSRLRVFLDDSLLHTEQGAVEPDVRSQLEASAGPDNVRIGHFGRFAHNKVLIQKRDGVAVKVLTGSANFSVRGLYVQANNVLLFDDPAVADLYEQAFEQAFNNPSRDAFALADIAKNWHEIDVDGCPKCAVSFAPHHDAQVSLERLAQAIDQAQSSVFFAIMELGGSGPVLNRIRTLHQRDVFTYGVTQSNKALSFWKPGSSGGRLMSFAYLQKHVPPPFQKEWGGGLGQVVHHKFIVVDFNDSDPMLFTGSSNLAAGGETLNGDNLIAIYDRDIAVAYGVEAVRLLDHYQFRLALMQATSSEPLVLDTMNAPIHWWMPYYNPDHIKYRDRLLFAK